MGGHSLMGGKDCPPEANLALDLKQACFRRPASVLDLPPHVLGTGAEQWYSSHLTISAAAAQSSTVLTTPASALSNARSRHKPATLSEISAWTSANTEVSGKASYSQRTKSQLLPAGPTSCARSESQFSTAGSELAALSDGYTLVPSGGIDQSAPEYIGRVVPDLNRTCRRLAQLRQKRQQLESFMHAAVKRTAEFQHLSQVLRGLHVHIRQVRCRNEVHVRSIAATRRLASSKKQWLLQRGPCSVTQASADASLRSGVRRAKELRHEYPKIRHEWWQVLCQLVARRHSLVVSAATHFRLEPKAVLCVSGWLVADLPPHCLAHLHALSTQMHSSPDVLQAVVRYYGGVITDMHELWMRTPCLAPVLSRNVGAQQDSNPDCMPDGAVSLPLPLPQPRPSASLDVRDVETLLQGSLSLGQGSFGSQVEADWTEAADGPATPMPPGGVQARSAPNQQLQSSTRTLAGPGNSFAKITHVMTVMGLEISSDVSRRAQMGELSWEIYTHLNMQRLNAAYGYIAQLYVFLARVLDVPMLYEVVLNGSYCSVRQHFARAKEGDEAHTQMRTVEHPLYVTNGRHEELKSFVRACILLGTNVQSLLVAHDMSMVDAQSTLENLEKVVASARSAVVQLCV